MLNIKIRDFSCGTGIIRQLSNARKAYKEGRPIDENIEVDEVGLTVFDDWVKVGEMRLGDNASQDLICPLILVDGDSDYQRLLTPDEIYGFTPERGKEYRLLVRRFQFKPAPSKCLYELIAITQVTNHTKQ